MPHRAALCVLALALLGPLTESPAGGLAASFSPIPAPAAGAGQPRISGRTLDGAPWTLDGHLGQVVLVAFWAGWCPPCIEEMPGLARLAQRMQGRPFVLAAVNAGDPEARVRHLARQLKLDFPVILDPDNVAFAAWGAVVLPTAYLVDGQGRPRLVAQGPVDWDDPQVLAAIESLLAEPP